MPSEAAHSAISTPSSAAAVRTIFVKDLMDALNKGIEDFNAKPSHPLFVALVYPAAMAVAIALTLNLNLIPLAFPIISGAAVLGPGVAVGLYELSRRREAGEDVTWLHAFSVPSQPSFPEILKLGGISLGIFLVWTLGAWVLYRLTIGEPPLETIGDFVNRMFLTPEGWTMIIVGNVMGLTFAVIGFIVGVISFPMVLDRNVSAATAVKTSAAAVAANPVTMAIWALIVTGSLIVGAMLALVGLVVVMPVLGHATWHLYKKVVV